MWKWEDGRKGSNGMGEGEDEMGMKARWRSRRVCSGGVSVCVCVLLFGDRSLDKFV